MSDEQKPEDAVRVPAKPLTAEEFRALVEAEARRPAAERGDGDVVHRLIATVFFLQGMVGDLGVSAERSGAEARSLRLALMCLCKARGGKIFVPLKHMAALGPQAKLDLQVDQAKQEAWVELKDGGVVIAGDFA